MRFMDWYLHVSVFGRRSGPVAFRKHAPGLTNRGVSAPRGGLLIVCTRLAGSSTLSGSPSRAAQAIQIANFGSEQDQMRWGPSNAVSFSPCSTCQHPFMCHIIEDEGASMRASTHVLDLAESV